MKKFKKLPWRTIISIAVLTLFALLVYRNWDSFVESFDAIKGANLTWIFVAFAGMVLTYFAAAGGYKVVSLKPLFYIRTLIAQLAASFANKLLPSGAGGLGLNGAYLLKNKYSLAESTTVVAVNSLAAFVSFSLLMLIALLMQKSSSDSFHIPHIPAWLIGVAVLVVLVVAVILAKNSGFRSKIKKFIDEMVTTILVYKNQKWRLVGAVVMATLVTLAYLLALFASAKSVGIDVTVAQVFLVYVLGALATAVTPTPGGLGGAEAALYAGFVALGVDSTAALSATLVYRFFTYWLPILPGYLSFQYLQNRKYL